MNRIAPLLLFTVCASGCPMLALEPCSLHACGVEMHDGLPPSVGDVIIAEVVSSTAAALVLDSWGLRFAIEFPAGSTDLTATFHPPRATRAFIGEWQHNGDHDQPGAMTAAIDISTADGPLLMVRSVTDDRAELVLRDDRDADRCYLDDGRVARIASLEFPTDDGVVRIAAGERKSVMIQETPMTLAARCPLAWDCANGDSQESAPRCGTGQLVARRRVE